MNKHFTILLFLLLALIGLVLSYVVAPVAKHVPQTKTEYKIVKKIVHDTIEVPVHEPALIIHYPVPADVDTAAILEAFFTSNIYVDTVHAGEFVDIKITDSVTCNKLSSHVIELLSLPEVVSTSPSAVSARCAALGVLAGTDLFAIKADYTVKKHNFSAGFDFVNKAPLVGYSYRLWTR